MRILKNLLAAAALALPAVPVSAQAPDLGDVVEVRLLEGWRRADGQHIAAIEVLLAPGWKTYWRSPGESGIPPRIELDAGAAVIHWPRPEVFHAGGLRSIGYHDQVLLPVELSLPAGAQRVTGAIELGVCRDICLPVSLALDAVLPGGGRPDPRIVAALSDQPLSAEEAGAGAATCRIAPISDGLRVEARMAMPDTGAEETVVFELPDPGIWVSEAAVERQGGTLIARADIVPPDASPFAMDRSALRITVIGAHMAVELRGCTGS